MSIQQELQRNQKEWLDKGIKKGIEKGIEQGVKQAKRDAAIGFYKKGLPISDIAEVLHLSIEQIEEILSSDSDDFDNNQSN